MNMLLDGGLNGFFESLVDNWPMILFVLLAILLLLSILFKRFKTAFAVFIIGALAAAVGLLAYLAFWLVKEIQDGNIEYVVQQLIIWAPTVLFITIVVLATFIGACRGLRKSLILLLHEVCIAAVCIAIYLVCIKVDAVNEFVLDVVNFFGNDKHFLENKLGISVTELAQDKLRLTQSEGYSIVVASGYGIKEVMVVWLPSLINDLGFYGDMMVYNPAYIYALADLVYHVAFALIVSVVFFLLDFVMYIVYHCCYSERKHRRKVEKEYVENRTDRRYNKHYIGGAVVGVGRGIALGLLSMAFLGTIFFALAGKGEEFIEVPEGIENKDMSRGFNVYRSISGYGTYGIFKVLNSISDDDDMPYYLWAADLVFSGELEDMGLDDPEKADVSLGIDENIVFRKEMGSYVTFARDTVNLLLKYDTDKKLTPLLNKVVAGELKDDDKKDAMDTVVEVMACDGFRRDFRGLISDFDTQTYIINFAMSFVNATIANIEQSSFNLKPEISNLLKVVFLPEWSDSIPDEKEYKDKGIKGEAPYIKTNKLVSKTDVQIVFDIVLDFLSADETIDGLELVDRIVPQIKDISLLSKNRETELNPVLCRLYCYAANTYLIGENEEPMRYSDLNREKVNWVEELGDLVDVTRDSAHLYQYLQMVRFEEDERKKDPNYVSNKLYLLINLFDDSAVPGSQAEQIYKDNMAFYDDICSKLAKSRLIGKALAMGEMYNLITDVISENMGDIYLPSNIVYETTFKPDGTAVNGEVQNLFEGVRRFARTEVPAFSGVEVSKRSKTLLESLGKNLMYEEDSNATSEQKSQKQKEHIRIFLKELKASDIRVKDGGYSLVDYVENSGIIRAVFSATLINDVEDIFVPNVAKECDAYGRKVNLITLEEFKSFFDLLDSFVDFVDPILAIDPNLSAEEKNEQTKNAITDFIENKRPEFDALKDGSKLFVATVGYNIEKTMGDGDDSLIVIPAALKNDPDRWVEIAGEKGEFELLLSAVEDKLHIELVELIKDDIENDELFDKIKNVTDSEFDDCLKSSVLHYTVSKYLAGDVDIYNHNASTHENVERGEITVVVPVAALQSLTDDTLKSIILKSELKDLLTFARECLPDSEPDPDPDPSAPAPTETEEERLAKYNKIARAVVKPEMKNVIRRSYIITASMAYFFAEDAKSAEPAMSIKIPQAFADVATVEELRYLNSLNPWMDEIPRLLNAFDELCEVSKQGEAFHFWTEAEETAHGKSQMDYYAERFVDEAMRTSEIDPASNRLAVCVRSRIAGFNLTQTIDDNVSDDISEICRNSAKDRYGNYTYEELEALCNSMRPEIFNITDTPETPGTPARSKLENYGEQAEKAITADLFKYNDEIPGQSEGSPFYGKSILQVIYSSYMITGKMSEVLDDYLLDRREEPDPGAGGTPVVPEEPNPYIDELMLRQIKGGGGVRYSFSEMSYLIDGLKMFNISNLDDINEDSFTIENLRDKSSEDIDMICRSDICRGVMTKQLKEQFAGDDGDHPLAYDATGIKVLRNEEITCLFELFKTQPEDEEIEDIAPSDLKLVEVRPYIKDPDDGRTRSYVIFGRIAHSFKVNSNLIIDRALYDTYGYINVNEIATIIDAFILMGYETIGDLNGEIAFPKTEAERNALFESEIVRAKISDQIFKRNTAVYNVRLGTVSEFYTESGKQHFIFSKTELMAISLSLHDINGDTSTYNFTSITIGKIGTLNSTQYDRLWDSDVISFFVSQKASSMYPGLTLLPAVPTSEIDSEYDESTSMLTMSVVNGTAQLVDAEELKTTLHIS